jgi:dihydroxyacid dehydratase/phosphogluconate dehydratase
MELRGYDPLMRMHDASLGDPVIEQPEPITLFLPILEASLRRAGIEAGRDEMLQRFMAGEPRIVIVAGARDHPAQIDDDDISRRAVAALWKQGALPFETSEPAVCDGIAQGHYGMTFSLVSRNLTAAALVSQLEAHVYDAALLLDSCDKRPVGDLAAVVEVDAYRRRRGRRPFYACFVPAQVMPERHLPKEIAEGLRALKPKANPGEAEEIDALLLHRLKCNTYAMFKKLLDGLEVSGALPGAERDRYLAEIAKLTCEAGGTCAFIGTGNTDKVVLHALGFVPREADLLTRAASEAVVARAAGVLLDAVRNRRQERSASALVRANLRNALRVWSAVGGSMNWMLHFPYVAANVGIGIRPGYVAELSDATPFLIDISPVKDKSFFTLAVEKQAGAHSGMDSAVKRLMDLGLVEDAPTLEGPWSERLRDARPANDRILMHTPLRSSSGIVEVRGNLTDSAVFKRAGMSPEALAQFDRKAFVVAFYLGEAEAQRDLFEGRVLKRLEGAVSAAELRHLARANFGDAAAPLDGAPDAGLLERAARERLLRCLVVIAGEGPKANGIPEMFYPSEYLNRDPVLRHVAALITDGRYSGATYGPCIGHASPEAIEGGGIGALRSGDVIYLDTTARRIDVLDADASFRDGGFRPVPLSRELLLARPEAAERLAVLRERRRNIPATIRLMLDATTSCREGITPAGLEIGEWWEARGGRP